MGIPGNFWNYRYRLWGSRSSNGFKGGYRLSAEVPQPLSFGFANRGERYQYLCGLSPFGEFPKTWTLDCEALTYYIPTNHCPYRGALVGLHRSVTWKRKAPRWDSVRKRSSTWGETTGQRRMRCLI